MRQRLHGGHDDTGNLALYIGRLSAEKQIERIRPVLDAMPQVRLALVGDGPHRQQLERIFQGTPTTFVGYLAGEELASAYASGDAFLFPSSTETLGLVLLEAMAAGCPVVGANRGGIPDIVSDGINGCLYDPDRSDSLITAVQRLMGSTETRLELAPFGKAGGGALGLGRCHRTASGLLPPSPGASPAVPGGLIHGPCSAAGSRVLPLWSSLEPGGHQCLHHGCRHGASVATAVLPQGHDHQGGLAGRGVAPEPGMVGPGGILTRAGFTRPRPAGWGR